MTDLPTKPADVLPHRGIALALDEISELVPGGRGTGIWTPDLRYFEGHFPDDPVLPGHWTTEAVNLIAGCVVLAAYPGYLALYREGAQKFLGVVRPGDRLEVVAEVTKLRDERGQVIAEATGYASASGKTVVKVSMIKIVAQPTL
jgi:3-hydroxyacyl-[acyl-carrier-protein] dehydratase